MKLLVSNIIYKHILLSMLSAIGYPILGTVILHLLPIAIYNIMFVILQWWYYVKKKKKKECKQI